MPLLPDNSSDDADRPGLLVPTFGRRGAGPRFQRVGPVGVVIMFASVLLAFFWLGSVGDGSPAPKAGGEEADRIPTRPRVEFVSDDDVPRMFPDEIAEETAAKIRDWFNGDKRRPINDRAAEEEEEWVTFLSAPEFKSPLERLPAFVFPELGQRDKVRHEPGPFRGALVSVLGEVRGVTTTELPTSPPSPGWRLTLRDAKGDDWMIISAREPGPEAVRGKWVRSFGIFVKLWPFPESGSPGFAVFSGQPTVPSYAPVTVTAVDESWGAQIRDDLEDTSQVKPGADGDAFWLLCNHILSIGTEGFAAKVAAGEIKPVDLTSNLGATALAKEPEKYRLKPVRLRVAVAQSTIETEPLTLENAGHVGAVVRAYCLDDQQRTIWLLSPLAKEDLPGLRARVCTVEGWFYKRMAVTKQNGTKYFMPVVVVASARPFGKPVSKNDLPYATIAAWVVVASIPVLIGVAAFWVARGKKRRAETLRRQEERIRARAAGNSEQPRPFEQSGQKDA